LNRRPPHANPASTKLRSPRRERGATLLEATAFLAVAAIVILGAVALFGVSFTGAKSARLTDETNAIAANVRALYSSPGAGGYAALSMTDLYHSGAFPTSLQATVSGADVTLTNMWGGAVSIAPGANSLPVLTYGNVPKAVCIDTLLSSGNWLSVTVNNTALPTTSPTVAQATAACTGSSNTIAWGFS